MASTLSFGELVRRHRLHRGLTQTRLAREAGITHSYVTHLETGRRTHPSREMVEKLAGALNLLGTERAVFFAAGNYASQATIVEPVRLDHPLVKAVSDYLELAPGNPKLHQAFGRLATELTCTIISRSPSTEDKMLLRGITNAGVGYFHRKDSRQDSDADQGMSSGRRRLATKVLGLLAILADGTLPVAKRLSLADELTSLAKWRLGRQPQAQTGSGTARKKQP